MIYPGEIQIDQQRVYELRQKIKDDSYVSYAIERIAERMTRELFQDGHDSAGASRNEISPFT